MPSTERISYKTNFTATYTGRSEFYSGIRHGERVLLTVETVVYWNESGLRREGGTILDQRQKSHVSLSVQNLDRTSAHLCIRMDEITDVSQVGPEATIPTVRIAEAA